MSDYIGIAVIIFGFALLAAIGIGMGSSFGFDRPKRRG